MEEDAWIELWKQIRVLSTIPGYSGDIVLASDEGAWNLADMSRVGASEYIVTLGPKGPILRAIFLNAVKTQDLWQNQARNEESLVKAFISPLLDAVFGPVRGTFSSWCVRNLSYSVNLFLVSSSPNFSRTHIEQLVKTHNRQIRTGSVARTASGYQLCTRMGGMGLILSRWNKLQGGKNPVYKWDYKTKLGYIMKAALDTLLSLSPLEEVKTFCIVVEGKGYLILFLSKYCQTANDVHIVFWYHFSRLPCNVVRDVPALGSCVYHEADRTVHGAAQQRGFLLGGAYTRDHGCTLGMATKI